MKHFKYTIVCLFAFLIKGSAAYHAGHISYTHVAGYTYKIKISLITNVLSSNNCQIDSFSFGDGTYATLCRTNGPVGNCSPCGDGLNFGSNLLLSEYQTTHTYSGLGTYALILAFTNRNSGIINISNSQNTVMFLQNSIIISTFSAPNSQPILNQILDVDFLCLNTGCNLFDGFGNDADGDSLAYSLQPCLTSNGFPATSFSYPAGTFTINAVTGLLTWCVPQMQGDYNVVIRIDEWRKDNDGTPIIISTLDREIQLKVSSCTSFLEITHSQNPVSITPNPTSNTFTLTFEHKSTERYTFEVVDLIGKKANCSITETENNYTGSLQNLNNGIYFITITGNKGTHITQKIIKH